MSDDPYSLDRMQDIAVGPPVTWWPLAPAWYLVLAIVLVLILWRTISYCVRHYQNRYRRAALEELSLLQVGDVRRLSELLKRVALVSYPVEQVASLTGKTWVQFLRQEVPPSTFGDADSPLETASYESHVTLEADAWSSLVRDARHWILKHQGRAAA